MTKTHTAGLVDLNIESKVAIARSLINGDRARYAIDSRTDDGPWWHLMLVIATIEAFKDDDAAVSHEILDDLIQFYMWNEWEADA